MANFNLHSISSSNRIRRELAHGEDYRAFKNIKDSVLQPVRSPIDVSIFVQRKRYVRKVEEDIKLSRSALGSKRGSNSTSKQGKSKSVPHIKHSFWERAKLTHKQYTDILSTPHLHGCGDIAGLKKIKPQALPSICSPRLAQMAHPSKRRILSVWQDHEQYLPVEALQRLHDMLYTTLNIDMKEARNFFKLCDKKKRKLERKLKQKKKKKRDQKETIWLRNQLELTSSAILNHFAEQPNLDTNFKQLLLSDVLLSVLGKLTEKKHPLSRYSSNLYDKELVKLIDKIAVWTENVSNIVDIQSLEEEEEEDKAEDQKEISKISEESFSLISSISLGEESHPDEQSKPAGEAGEPGLEGEGTEAELEKVSSLQRLIQILAQASSAYLSNHAGYEDLTRNELLHRMKILNRQYIDTPPSEIMKSILLDWAMHSAPDQVDSQIIGKIEKTSELLAAMIDAEEIYGMNIKPETVAEAVKDGERGSIPGTTKPTEKEDTKKASDLTKVTEAGEGKPEPGTLTEIKAPDGTVQMGVVDENGEVTPVQLTPSGNLIPTVYDKNAKVVNQVFDKEGTLLDSTFNKFGVPEPDKYNGPLFDDEKKPHELIYNSKGKIIPQCYDKDGNPIAADYDSDGNPIQYGEDGKPVPAEQGDSTEKDNQDEPIPSEKGPQEPAAKESQPESKTKTEEKVEEKAETPKDKDDQPSSAEEKAEIKKEEAPDSKEKEKPPEVVDTSKEGTKGTDNPPTVGEKGPAPESPAQEGEKPKEEAKEIPPEKADVKEEDKKTEGLSETQGQSPEEDKKASEANVEKDPKEELVKDEQKERDEKVIAEDDKGIEEQKVETTPDDKKQTEEQEKTDEAPGETEKTPEEELKEEEMNQKEIDEDVGEEESEGEEEGEGEDEGEEKEEGEGVEEGKVEEPQGEEPPAEEQPEEEPAEVGALQEEEKSLGELEVGDKILGVKEKGLTIIRGHTPRRIQEHSKDTVCCLSLKIWAVWLLEITHNAHNWTKWITNIISQIREFAAILRGEILLPNGQKRIIFKEDWNKFINDMNEDVIAWRQYSRHINDLTQKIIEKFHGKKIYCCEKCLQDHLIKNVVAAHDTMRALTEALNCTGYWQRCLDEIVQATSKLFSAMPPVDEYSSESETGWSYSTSSDDENISYMFKNIETMPLSSWKQPESKPCRCQGQVKQLFPRPPQSDVNYTKSYSFGQIDKNISRKY